MELFPSPLSVYSHPSGLKELPETAVVDPQIHWVGDDGANVFIEIQGQLCCVAVRKGPLSITPAKRQEINGFSKASRLRLFKLTNRLEFSRAGRCTFATQTWRDEVGRPTPAEITAARSNCQKSLERLAGQECAGFWRVEWKMRESGRFVGQPMPHLHVIYFNMPFVPVKDWAACWARAIGWEGRVSLKLEEIQNLRKCLYYVSKYIAKLDALSNLDIASYLSEYQGGRRWGTYRKNLIPVADKTEIRIPPGDLADRIRAVAIKAWDKTPVNPDVGFSIFGPAAQEVQRLVDEWVLQNRQE